MPDSVMPWPARRRRACGFVLPRGTFTSSRVGRVTRRLQARAKGKRHCTRQAARHALVVPRSKCSAALFLILEEQRCVAAA
jgi:hypothetical protein